MAFIPVPGAVKVVFNYQLPSAVAALVLHVARLSGSTSAWSLGDLTAMSTAVGSEWVEEMLPLQNAGVTLINTVCTDLTTVTGLQVTVPYGAAGGVSGEALPNQTALLIKESTAVRGRSFRGRVYIPGFTVSDSDITGAPLLSHLTNVNNAFGAVRADLQALAVPADFCIVSRFSGTNKTIPGKRPQPIPRVGGGIFTNLLGNTAATEWATQRRRRHS